MTNYKEIKKRKTGFKRVGVIFVVIVSLVSVVALADIFSTALTTGKFSFGIFKVKDLKLDSRILYAVCMGESDDKFTAYNIAGGVSVLGAGGYVWHENNYKVVANIYQSLDDATKIVNNISNTNYEVSVHEINLNSVDIDKFELEDDDKVLIYDIICRIYQLYIDLYDMSNNIDTKKITYIQASSIANSYKSEAKVNISKLEEIISRSNNHVVKNIRDTYVHIIDILDGLVYKLLEDNQTTTVVKYCEIDVVYRLFLLLKSL